MADLPNDFWSGWIILITGLSFAALVWVTLSIYFSKDGTADAHGEEPVWDENLKEGNHAPPLWWFWLILAAMVFSVVYLLLYPGLGSFKGVLDWSQDSRVTKSYRSFNETFAEARQNIRQSSLSDLQNNADYMLSAARVFNQHCAACHGSEAEGQGDLFPNLSDDYWQWGGSAEQIEQTIRNGRSAAMLAWQQTLGDEKISDVADYVLALAEDQDVLSTHPAHTTYTQFCVSCHGVNGEGNALLGAPNIRDSDWLYGGDREAIIKTITFGRNGVMPAFNERLDDVQIKLLVAWLMR